MLLNFGKCKCLHTGQGNLELNHKMGDTVLGIIVNKKDLKYGLKIIGLITRNTVYNEKRANYTSV